MTELEEVARHYSHGSLEAAIRAGLKAMGRVDAEVTPDDLAGIDEFHIGGHEATADLGDKLEIGSGATLLDISAPTINLIILLPRRPLLHVRPVHIAGTSPVGFTSR
jgi:hypothetical protein